MRSYFIVTCLLVYALSFFMDTRVFGFTYASPLYTHASYMFVHIGWVHLLLNIVGIFGFSTAVRRVNPSDLTFLVSMLAAGLASFGAEMDLPTVGASGVAYALMGIYTAYNLRPGWLVSVCLIFTLMLISAQASHSNYRVHLFAFTYAFIIYSIQILWTRRNGNKRLSASA